MSEPTLRLRAVLRLGMLAVAAVCFSLAARADTIILKSGAKIKGKVVAEDGEWVKVRVTGGVVLSLKRKDIKHIQRPGAPPPPAPKLAKEKTKPSTDKPGGKDSTLTGTPSRPRPPSKEQKATGVRFAAALKVSKEAASSEESGPGKLKISFTASAATDAEVAILDSKGRIVRHLAAGMLGRNAPEPFKKDSLAQELLWDGKDDRGRTVRAASVRVRLGLKIGRAKVLDCRPPGGKALASKNRPAPKLDGTPSGLYKAAFGGNLSSASGAYLLDNVIWLCGDADSGAFFFRSNRWDKWCRIEPATGTISKVRGMPYATGSLVCGSDGQIYLFPWGWATWRMNRDWKPAPFPGTGRAGIRAPKRNGAEIDASGYGDGMGPQSFCLGLDGKVYGLISHPQTGYARLHVWGRDGKLEKGGYIPFARVRHASNIRVDRQGFLYVALNGLPEGYKPPQPLDPACKRTFTGTIVKLKVESRWTDKRDPEAGTVPADPAKKAAGLVLDSWKTSWSDPQPGSAMGYGRISLSPAKVFVPDVAQAMPGISWITTPPACTCSGPWFDMDRFGRLYVPDPALSRVRILDSGGNELAVIAEKSGEVAIAWPGWVASAGDVFAFWDLANKRVVSARIEFAATETVALP